MAYKYQEIWDRIKKSLDGSVEITVHEDILPTVVQGVKRTKSAENVSRPLVGLVRFSKLVITKELLSKDRRLWKVKFKLLYDTRL